MTAGVDQVKKKARLQTRMGMVKMQRRSMLRERAVGPASRPPIWNTVNGAVGMCSSNWPTGQAVQFDLRSRLKHNPWLVRDLSNSWVTWELFPLAAQRCWHPFEFHLELVQLLKKFPKFYSDPQMNSNSNLVSVKNQLWESNCQQIRMFFMLVSQLKC